MFLTGKNYMNFDLELPEKSHFLLDSLFIAVKYLVRIRRNRGAEPNICLRIILGPGLTEDL